MVIYKCPTISFCDTDSGGVVYHTKYLELAERARAEMLTHLGLSNKILWDQGFIFAVTIIAAKYYRPAVLGDDLTISTKLLHLTRVRIQLEQIVKKNENVLVTINIHLACLTKDGKPKAMSETIHNNFATLNTNIR